MKAIVCDKCGKVILLEEDRSRCTYIPDDVFILRNDRRDMRIELCEACGNELIAAVRGKESDT